MTKSLGKARDTYAAKIEIRAVALVALLNGDELSTCADRISNHASDEDCPHCGWNDHLWTEFNGDRGRDTGTSSDSNSPGYQAGWLAREIQQHDFYRAREEEEEVKRRIELNEALEWRPAPRVCAGHGTID